MDKELLYKKCVSFHGHECGGLLIGFRAALLAMELLDIAAPASDEETVCIAENDACGVDAVQALLGCTAGKGNLIIERRGKQAFTFFNRVNGRSCRLVLKERTFASREEKRNFMRTAPGEEIFEVQEAAVTPPPQAEIYRSQKCAACQEMTAEPWLRVRNGRLLCLSCFEKGL